MVVATLYWIRWAVELGAQASVGGGEPETVEVVGEVMVITGPVVDSEKREAILSAGVVAPAVSAAVFSPKLQAMVINTRRDRVRLRTAAKRRIANVYWIEWFCMSDRFNKSI